MANYLDLKKVNFTCRKCGNCCYNILRKVKIDQYGYNFQGKFQGKFTSSKESSPEPIFSIELVQRVKKFLIFPFVFL